MPDAPLTVRTPGPLGRRAHAFALIVATRLRWLGTAVGMHEITFRKARHARDFVRLQARDEMEGLTR